jgi:para-nitrobenzyl esterase
VLEEPVGTALAAGRFARVPILNGTNHDEQRDFVTAAEAVNDGAYVPVPEPVTAESYQRVIASVLSVPAARAAAIAAEYPLSAYPSPPVAFSTLVSDANFACPALQRVDVRTARQELALPPKLTFGQVKGFTLYATRTILSGGGEELVELAKTNLRELAAE